MSFPLLEYYLSKDIAIDIVVALRLLDYLARILFKRALVNRRNV